MQKTLFDTESNKNKEKVLELLSRVNRDGMEELTEHLLRSDYFTAPASTKFHGSYEGGLLDHSLNVTEMLLAENALWEKPLPEESCIIIGLLHDVCKVGYYKKLSKGEYVADKSVKGHAKLSISRIKNYIELTKEEEDVILYHMGLFGAFGYGKEYDVFEIHKAVMSNAHVQVFAAIDMAESRRKA